MSRQYAIFISITHSGPGTSGTDDVITLVLSITTHKSQPYHRTQNAYMTDVPTRLLMTREIWSSVENPLDIGPR